MSDLSAFGYAPGKYWCNCRDCLTQMIADKRAWRCKPCAEKAANATPPASQESAGEAVGLSMKEHFEAWQNERVGRRALVKAQQAATIDPFELFAAGFIRGKATVEVGHE